MIRRLAGYILRNWRFLAISILCIIISTYLNLYIPRLSGEVIREILIVGNYDMLVSIVMQILAIAGILGVFSFIERYTNAYFSQKVVYEIRNDVFKSLQSQSFAFYDKSQTGQLMSRATTDVDRIRMFLGFQMIGFMSSTFLFGGVIISMILIDSELTLLIFAIAPFLFIIYSFYGKKIRAVIHTAREHFGNLTSIIWENLVGIRIVRSFTREEYEKEKFHKPNKDYYDWMLDSVKIRSIFMPLTNFLAGLVTIIVYWYGGSQVIYGRLSVDQLYVFSAYAGMLLRPFFMIGMLWASYQSMVAAGERVFEIIDAKPEVEDKPNAIMLPSIKGHVVFENVSFGYDKNKLTVKNINLEVKSGETVALLGHTGSGKSTIIRLLPRFYDVTSGRILIDRYDIRDVKLNSLRVQMGIVSQETFLFNMSVRENIAFGKPNATMDEIIQAAKIAKAHDFIIKLSNGYDTIIGERGVTLSGGQQQRVSIARALLMNPHILILDDSTSSVDVDTEYEIQQALSALLKDRTAFIITQRVSTIRDANKIVVLENGRIVEEGTHEELMKKKGAYYRIYQTLYEAQREALTAAATTPHSSDAVAMSHKDPKGGN